MILPRLFAGEGDPISSPVSGEVALGAEGGPGRAATRWGVEGATASVPLDFAPSTSFAGPPPPFAARVGRIR